MRQSGVVDFLVVVSHSSPSPNSNSHTMAFQRQHLAENLQLPTDARLKVLQRRYLAEDRGNAGSSTGLDPPSALLPQTTNSADNRVHSPPGVTPTTLAAPETGCQRHFPSSKSWHGTAALSLLQDSAAESPENHQQPKQPQLLLPPQQQPMPMPPPPQPLPQQQQQHSQGSAHPPSLQQSMLLESERRRTFGHTRRNTIGSSKELNLNAGRLKVTEPALPTCFESTLQAAGSSNVAFASSRNTPAGSAVMLVTGAPAVTSIDNRALSCSSGEFYSASECSSSALSRSTDNSSGGVFEGKTTALSSVYSSQPRSSVLPRTTTPYPGWSLDLLQTLQAHHQAASALVCHGNLAISAGHDKLLKVSGLHVKLLLDRDSPQNQCIVRFIVEKVRNMAACFSETIHVRTYRRLPCHYPSASIPALGCVSPSNS